MSERRYRLSEHQKYHRVYDTRKQSSPIISPQNVSDMGTGSLQDKRNLERLLDEYAGTENGYFVRNNERVPSQLRLAEEALQEIQDEFEKLNKRRAAAGKLPMKELPDRLLQEKLEAEARLDIVKEEIQELKKRIANFQEKEDTRSTKRMLQYGCMEMASLRGGIVDEIDGQNVEQGEDGLLRIQEPDSPFDGLVLQVYRHLVAKRWKERRKASYRKEMQKYKQAKKEGRDVAMPKPRIGNRISRNQLPERPSDKEVEQFMQENDLIPESEAVENV